MITQCLYSLAFNPLGKRADCIKEDTVLYRRSLPRYCGLSFFIRSRYFSLGVYRVIVKYS
jgi:hypothetical protein